VNAALASSHAAPGAATPLSAFRGRHGGETLIVCGCGAPAAALAGAWPLLTIGVNDIGRLFNPTYLVVVNPPRQFRGDRFRHVRESKAQALFTQLDLGPVAPPVVRFQLGQYGGTDTEGDMLHHTQNSPYVAVCLAAFMGAKRIGLIGVDFTEHHFFGATGRHPLAGKLATIDREYGALAQALAVRGVELVNLSPVSRLSSLRKVGMDWLGAGSAPAPRTALPSPARGGLRIVSYATTPVAGVPELLARCIAHATGHNAQCVWAGGSYGNGVAFEGGMTWGRQPRQALPLLEAADLVIVHNGKVDPAHSAVLQGKPVLTMAHNYGWNVDMQHVRRGMPGVVVGQYQATLPEFAGWRVVPNPVPLWDADHMPDDKAGPVRVAYTPSGRHDRYPPGHRLYWHGKGWQTTQAALARLAAERGVQVESTAAGQVSHAQALAMKRRAHIVVDECVTGSYHRNSLEGLAAGAVVVNGVGLLPGVEAALRACAPAAEGHPFVGCSLETLHATLQALVDEGPQALALRGRAGRAWMLRHWDFAEQWQRCWMPAVEEALGRAAPRQCVLRGTAPGAAPADAAAAEPAPIAIPCPPRPAQEPVMTPAAADRLSVVIPHRGSERLPLLAATLVSLAQSPAVGEIIVAEIGTSPLAADAAAAAGARHLFIADDGPFSRARALNAGTAVARHEVVAWHDNDLLNAPEFLALAFRELQERGLDFLLPYAAVHYLGEADAQAVRQGVRAAAACRPVNVLASDGDRGHWIGCIGLVRRAFVQRHGGLVEGFRGWGGEDDAWFHKVRLLGRIAATRHGGQFVFHLHHALSGGLEPGRPGAANPHYADNVELLRQVRQVRDGAVLAQRFPPAPPATGRLTEVPVLTPAAAPGPTIWSYWEGPCPDWVRACRRSFMKHLPQLRLLDPESFEALRRGDADQGIGLTHLHVAHRADFIRAWLLQRHGGLWIDADCLVMQPLDEVLALQQQHDFIAHRAREGVLSNAFIGAAPGSRIARAYYERVRTIVARKLRFSWNWLGGDLLTEVCRQHPGLLHELPCERVQPICWSRPQDFLAQRSAAEHETLVDARAWTYMLSNVELGKRFPEAAAHGGLLAERSFFMHLLRRSTGDDALAASLQRELLAADQAALYRRHRCESVSGTGSTLAQTATLRACLPQLLQHLGVRSLLDAPCGDRHWIRQLRLAPLRHIGVDLLGELVAAHRETACESGTRFVAADVVSQRLPHADAVLCRDLLPHLGYGDIAAVLRNFRRSGATWLLTTHFTRERGNVDTTGGRWRALNLTQAPFRFPPPRLLLNEGCSEDAGAFDDKCLAVWRLAELPLDAFEAAIAERAEAEAGTPA